VEAIVIMIIHVFSLYLVTGVFFAIIFIWRGLHRVDTNTTGSSIWFRLLIMPGVSALWPLFLIKWINAPRS
jgi:hypothetical protein